MNDHMNHAPSRSSEGVAVVAGAVGTGRGHSIVVLVRIASAAIPKLASTEISPHASSSMIVWTSWRVLARADPSQPRTYNTTNERNSDLYLAATPVP